VIETGVGTRRDQHERVRVGEIDDPDGHRRAV
jgi:hypothetical protein